MLIMGIDPGSQVTGFGCISVSTPTAQPVHVAHGIIRLTGAPSFAERLSLLAREIDTLLEKYRPDHVVVEKIFLGRNADSAFKLGHARGVVIAQAGRLVLADNLHPQIHEYATRLVKKAVGGAGSADKTQVQRWVQHLLRLPQMEHLDASDALALALFQAQMLTANQRLSTMKELQ